MAQNLTMRAILMHAGSLVDWPMGMASQRLGLLVSSHTPSLLPELMMEGAPQGGAVGTAVVSIRTFSDESVIAHSRDADDEA
jgi:hypothetical protein